MVKLRLKRNGKKFQAIYKIVAADARSPRDGRFIEEVGFYNPHSKEVVLNKESLTKWLNQGAQPTDTVRKLLKHDNFYAEYTKNRK
ncbi:30S ribosomal protein S16 [Mycoplasma sp. 128]|uniref:30S ribosomal protein S16 n=1 Tax=Mycoplasma sp. 3341 TaxID=3447506 RepID=UPI003F658046